MTHAIGLIEGFVPLDVFVECGQRARDVIGMNPVLPPCEISRGDIIGFVQKRKILRRIKDIFVQQIEVPNPIYSSFHRQVVTFVHFLQLGMHSRPVFAVHKETDQFGK
ncbi:MAG: hypothetical protein ACSHW1_19425 [Yoonia sp.]|uniref:hypothetical protein n=1 Tax=Yoonia sp. TaxID=2212373 RepID=UPI003EF49C76